MADGTDQILEQWRKHAEGGVRMMDAVVEATTHMREAQLAAAQETHERMQALQKSLFAATSAFAPPAATARKEAKKAA